jgi:hypothetical protein
MDRMARRLLALLIGCAFALVAAELLVRAAHPPQMVLAAAEKDHAASELFDPAQGEYLPDPETGYAPRLDSRDYGPWGELRNGYPREKGPGVRRVMFVGDSVTKRGRIVDALRELHAADAGLEFWNCGVEGWATAQELVWARRHAPSIRPDEIVLTFHVNDFMTTPVVFQQDGRIWCVHPKRPLAELDPFLLRYSHLYRFALGLAFDGGSFEATDRAGLDAMAGEVAESLAGFAELARGLGARFSVLVFPAVLPEEHWPPVATERYERALEIAAEQDLRRFELRPALREAAAAGLPLGESPTDFHHPSQALAELMARELYAAGLLAE